MRFCDNLRQIRQAQRLTQRELADKMQWSQSRIAGYELGTREPKVADIEQRAKVLGVPYASLAANLDLPETRQTTRVVYAMQNNEKLAQLFSMERSLQEPEIDALITIVKSMIR